MRKVLIPKKDYVKELIKIIRVTKDEQKLRGACNPELHGHL